MKLKGLLAASILICQTPAFAEGAAALSEAEVQTRAEAIQKTLRCVVCQNQSIADSHSFLAEDMRGVVEKRVRLGESDEEVRAYMQAKYGDFVLMKPPVKLSTYLLWFGPFLLLGAGVGWYVLNVRRPGTDAPSPAEPDLSADERKKLDALLNSSDEDETNS